MQTKICSPETDSGCIAEAARLLRAGELVVIPTETVYGLAADALNARAVKKIYEAKGRPSDNPLIVHIASFDELAPLVREVPERARKLADAFWPGPLTVILPKSDAVPAVTSGGLDTVAIRMPSHETARAVIRAAGVPLAAPSANISGFPSPTRVAYAADDMTGRVPLIIDGGDCTVGVESTVVTLATPTPVVLRPGGITPEQLEQALGEPVAVDDAVLHPLKEGEKAASPGMKYKHYAPQTDILVYRGGKKGYFRFLERRRTEGVYALCFEEDEARCPVPAVSMGREADALSQTRRLFDAFRELDETGARVAYAFCPPSDGVGLAVCNRLFRAAAFRFIDEAPILGLTGQTGAGKSTVAALLRARGFAVVDCDAVARTVTERGSPVLSALAASFGVDVLRADGSLDRHKLAARVFPSAEKTRLLNSLTHPAILSETKRQAFAFSEKNIPCVIDAPLLFQSGLDSVCDRTVAVVAPEELRLSRIMARDGIDEQTARTRMSAQEDERFYADRADILVRNYPPFDLEREVRAVTERRIP